MFLYREGPARPRRYSHNIIEIFTVLNCLCVFYFSLRNSDYKSADRTAVAYFTVVVLGSKMNTASFFSGIDWHERCTYSCTLFVCNQRNTTGDDGLRHVAPIGEAGCGTGGTQWCARHVGSQGQVSSPPGFRLHRHLLMPPTLCPFSFFPHRGSLLRLPC